MKIEIGESLLLSWLRHVKECQLVQTNWKASSKWELKYIDVLEKLMTDSSEFFANKYGYGIYKGTSNVGQLILQAEIDVMGINFDDSGNHIYAIDVAFHTNGLQYGGKMETVEKIIKKFLRTAMCIYGYYGITEGTLVFASPKIHMATMSLINECSEDIGYVLNQAGLNYKIRIIANEDFNEKILEPVLNTVGDVADTSELFIRSLQMYNLFAGGKPKALVKTVNRRAEKIIPTDLETIEFSVAEGLDEMKIGTIVRTVLRGLLEKGEVSKEEVALMQTKEYSKETFDLQYPLLIKSSSVNYVSPKRYYATPVQIRGEEYFICSEWFETSANNDRPLLIKWLKKIR
ncbi:MAG TPA: hypothetical protein PK147_07475 [Saprospiraceae bacterium]|nr:hypothetical protein [Saprospiraceae bacterium]